MSTLDFVALAILLILLLAIAAAWFALALLPGKIARKRNHPQADAINACGWWGAITLGLLMPVAFIWAYSNPRWREQSGTVDPRDASSKGGQATG